MISFDDILGQPRAIALLTQAYEAQRLPHGLIFAGPGGVGKETTARALAGLFLCEKPKALRPCEKCESCRIFDAGNHPDYHVIYRELRRLEKETAVARDISVEVIRPFLIEPAGLKPSLGVGKVFLVRDADLMSAGAQNSLLKTLEEPLGHTLIILLTDQPDALLPTIRSRSQLVPFVRLEEKLVREQLVKRDVPRDVAAAAARVSGGSIGTALRWIGDGIVERIEQLEKLMAAILAGGSAEPLREWLKKSAEDYFEKVQQRDEKASKDQSIREGTILYLMQIARILRENLVSQADSSQELERTCRSIDAIVRAETYLESNVNTPLVLHQFAGALGKH